jgi:hypothetical protein
MVQRLSDKGDTTFPGKRGRPKKEAQNELTTLRQGNEVLKEEVELLKKAGVLCKRTQVKYAFIKIHRPDHSLSSLFRTLFVSISGYYDWLDRPQSNT